MVYRGTVGLILICEKVRRFRNCVARYLRITQSEAVDVISMLGTLGILYACTLYAFVDTRICIAFAAGTGCRLAYYILRNANRARVTEVTSEEERAELERNVFLE